MKNNIYSRAYSPVCRRLSLRPSVNIHAPRPRRFFACLLIMFAAFVPRASAQLTQNETDAAIYFNAAMEKYIQGDIESAASNAAHAAALEPGNTKIAEFAARIFYDGAQDAHNARDYKKALGYLEKARVYNPSDARIANLYDVTKNIMERTAPPSASPKSAPASSAAKPAAAVKPAPPLAPHFPIVAEPPPPPMYAVTKATAALFAAAAAAFIIVNIVIVFIMPGRIKKYERKVAIVVEENEKLKNVAAARAVELERMKEALKYEKENSIRAIGELKEEKNIKNRHFEEQLRLGLDIRQRQIEEILKGGALFPSDSQNAAVHGGRAKVLESIGDATYIDEDSSVALDAARERIASHARELYSVSPNGCLTFLKEMSTNLNPLIRANIAKSLAGLANDDTLELLVGLWRDKSPKVRREALRELKRLRDAVRRGAVSLDDKSAARLAGAVSEALREAEWVF
ncbi:MAG: HEAT repeat domain-containing protein [Endomicrobiia bacterium]|nr:HEAT repeat domain-containing protein [Endomicrobiia bacterium]